MLLIECPRKWERLPDYRTRVQQPLRGVAPRTRLELVT